MVDRILSKTQYEKIKNQLETVELESDNLKDFNIKSIEIYKGKLDI
jgi:hypothetical protein